MKWDRHYTGIETTRAWNINRQRVFCDLYLQRDANTKSGLQFVRFSLGYRRRNHWRNRSIMLGVFLDRVNHLPGFRGWEVFTDHFRFGWCKRENWFSSRRWVETKWSGSSVDPYCAFSFRVWRIGFGFDSPAFLRRWKERRESERWERECAAYEEAFTAQGYEDHADDDEEVRHNAH